MVVVAVLVNIAEPESKGKLPILLLRALPPVVVVVDDAALLLH